MLVPFKAKGGEGLEDQSETPEDRDFICYYTLTHTKAYLNWLANDL